MDENETFNIAVSSMKLTEARYTGTKNGAAVSFSTVPATDSKPGVLTIKGIKHRDKVVIVGLTNGSYTITETYTGRYTPSYAATKTEGGSAVSFTQSDSGITVTMDDSTGDVTAAVTNTKVIVVAPTGYSSGGNAGLLLVLLGLVAAVICAGEKKSAKHE